MYSQLVLIIILLLVKIIRARNWFSQHRHAAFRNFRRVSERTRLDHHVDNVADNENDGYKLHCQTVVQENRLFIRTRYEAFDDWILGAGRERLLTYCA